MDVGGSQTVEPFWEPDKTIPARPMLSDKDGNESPNRSNVSRRKTHWASRSLAVFDVLKMMIHRSWKHRGRKLIDLTAVAVLVFKIISKEITKMETT